MLQIIPQKHGKVHDMFIFFAPLEFADKLCFLA